MEIENENVNTTEEATQEYKHQNRERLCYYTNELYTKDEIVKYTMSNRGYGSIFDCDNFTIQLHKDVADKLNQEGVLKPEWFDNDEMFIETPSWSEKYEHEEDIDTFINSLILENREYIQNCENCFCYKLDRKDWIEINK